MWESSLWVPKHCSLPAIISFTVVGMLKNYGWLGRRGKKITVTFKYLAESQKHCEQRFSITTAAMRETQTLLGGVWFVGFSFLFWVFFNVLNSKLLSQNTACWGLACPFSLSWDYNSPSLSHWFLSAVINRDHLVFHSPSFSYFHSTFNSLGTSDSWDGSEEAGLNKVRL